RQVVCASCLAEVVGDRFLAQHVLAGFERGPGELEVRVAGSANVDDIDVVAFQQLTRIVGGNWNIEFVRRVMRPIDFYVRDRNDPAARIACVPGQVGLTRPGTCSEHAHAYEVTVASHRAVAYRGDERAT